MELTRRDFVRICTGTVAGIGVSGMFHPFVRDVLAETLTGQRPPVFWVEGQGCTGCTVSLLNNAHPGIAKRMSGIHLAIPVFSKGYRQKQGKVVP